MPYLAGVAAAVATRPAQSNTVIIRGREVLARGVNSSKMKMSLPTNPRLAAAARAVLAEPHARVSRAAICHLLEPSTSASPPKAASVTRSSGAASSSKARVEVQL